MIKKFNDLPWHDAELKELIIDRNDMDIVKIVVKWPQDSCFDISVIEFFNCYAFRAEMNFGVFPPDFILDAECIMQSQELDDLKILWAKIGLDLSKLCCFKIVTNSTNSIINIFSLGFRVTAT